MTEKDQKIIFSRNLNKYLSNIEKTQKEVAASIGVSPQTFNTWTQGIALPRMGKVQLLADYFGINKSDLIEDKSNDTSPDVMELTPGEVTHLKNYRCLDDLDKARIDERMETLLEADKYHKKDITIAG